MSSVGLLVPNDWHAVSLAVLHDRIDSRAGAVHKRLAVSPGRVVDRDELGLLDEGEALTNFEVAVRLHQLVRALPWQNEVQRALHQATV